MGVPRNSHPILHHLRYSEALSRSQEYCAIAFHWLYLCSTENTMLKLLYIIFTRSLYHRPMPTRRPVSIIIHFANCSTMSFGRFRFVPSPEQELVYAIRCFELIMEYLERDVAGISDSNQSLLNGEVEGLEREVGHALTPEVQYACSMRVLSHSIAISEIESSSPMNTPEELAMGVSQGPVNASTGCSMAEWVFAVRSTFGKQ